MAKEQFTRSKPHVNVSLLPKLIQRGFTPTGANQILQGLIVTDAQDRKLIAETLAEHEEIYFTVRLNDGR